LESHQDAPAPGEVTPIQRHLVITPARNEAENLKRLGASLIAQTWLPTAWCVVDNGSTDETEAVVRAFAAEHDWITFLSIPGEERAARGRASVRAFNAGVGSLSGDYDLITNLDADVSFAPEYFDGLRESFVQRPNLGIASGLCYERELGEWQPVHVTYPNLRGASRSYRRACLTQLMPLEERLGWDGIDSVRANIRGWETATIPALSYYHHRPTGARDDSRFSGWAEEGSVSYYMWYRAPYLVARTLYRVFGTRDPAAAGLVWGYARAALRREPRHAERGFREFVHEQQTLGQLPTRLRQIRGTYGAAAIPGLDTISVRDQWGAYEREPDQPARDRDRNSDS
jgi:glycosyltransferase involved in cell wall biosynthesis